MKSSPSIWRLLQTVKLMMKILSVFVAFSENVNFKFPQVFLKIWKILFVTGKSLSEALIFSSINPQYDNRLINELRVQYEKLTRAEHFKNMSFTQIV